MSIKAWSYCFALGAVVMLAIVLATSKPNRDERQAARESELREASQRRTSWQSFRWPPPETTIRISSPFGKFAVPLANIGGRDELVHGPYFSKTWSPSGDGAYHWTSFALAFWMPDGAGVVTEPGWLSNNFQIDPNDLKGRRAPFRPKEEGRLDPSSDRFVVVVGAFCPRNGSKPGGDREGVTLSGMEAMGGGWDMRDCSTRMPVGDWHQVRVAGPGRTTIYCRPGFDICFGWIDLADFGQVALTYFPDDALDRVPAIAARLDTLLQSWAEGAGKSKVSH